MLFSPFDGCERINQTPVVQYGMLRYKHSTHSLLLHVLTFTSDEEI
jgi:hypothetical protein